jgi:diguanylate cyclase (GGDEF)-like protein
LVFSVRRHAFLLLFLFYLVNAILTFYLFRRKAKKKYSLEYQAGNLQEKLNILNEEKSRELKTNLALKAKIIRYNGLKKVVEELNASLDLDSVADKLVSIAFSLVSNNKGVCVLYLIDNQTQKLNLFKAKKEDKKLIIRAKEGTIFDLWVLRHASPLLVEDIKNDFRFDLEKLRAQDMRPVASLVSSPLISEHSFLGILKSDYQEPGFYNQEDLRLLSTICDLGAVALENSQLFQKTQDLAIHDGLTSLYTKGYFLERLKEECKRSIHQNTVFSLLMLDIDFFKNYNDKFGHTAGDIVLRNLSGNITESLKGLNPVTGRFGGEEFCVILRGIDKKKACHVAEGLRQRIEKEKIILRRVETSITVSIGIATFPSDASDEDELILKSDKAMYEAKQKGRNRVCCI